ncbi:MAG: riboflavin synthase [Planctomycetota bacterium]|nr:riboflavin synthase [Planctomycetota bacterium]MDA1106408.1 riboflavin synthase [Planctomycetota bacterium]
MFTGLIRARGVVSTVERRGGSMLLAIRQVPTDGILHGTRVGDSIAIDGCCLTATSVGAELCFDVIEQTIALTTLGSMAPGRCVHLEPALRMGDPLGGHLVQGHVDGRARVHFAGERNGFRLVVEVPERCRAWMLPQGSVAINGVSLTIAEADPAAGRFGVALIPETLRATNLGQLVAGDDVNLECDQLAKVIHARLAQAIPASPPPS